MSINSPLDGKCPSEMSEEMGQDVNSEVATGQKRSAELPIALPVSDSFAHKRIKLDAVKEEKAIVTRSATKPTEPDRKNMLEFFTFAFRRRRETYVDRLLELFFLEQQGNLMEYYAWRKRAPTLPLLHYLREVCKQDSDEFESLQTDKARLDSVPISLVKIVPISQLSQPPPPPVSAAACAVSTSSVAGVTTPSAGATNAASSQLSTVSASALPGNEHAVIFSQSSSATSSTHLQPQSPCTTRTQQHVNNASSTAAASAAGSTVQEVFSSSTTPAAQRSLSASGLNKHGHNFATGSILGVTPISTKLSAFSGRSSTARSSNTPGTPFSRQTSGMAYANPLGSQEQIVERAKQEAHVVQRVAELRKEGLWSSKRLPKVHEPSREKAHWDYLLEEMEWLATDFAQERKWKKAAAKKCARMISRYHLDQRTQVEKAERDEQQRLRRLAGSIAKEVRNFWTSVEKLVEFKMQTKLEEKRKKALDLHLNYIVDQTEKFSSWLTEGLNKSEKPSRAGSLHGDSPMLCGEINDEPEEEQPLLDDVQPEVDPEPSESPFQDVLGPQEEPKKDDDKEFTANSDDDEEDDEMTIAEQERQEKNDENEEELRLLEDEANMPVEKLLELYAGAYEIDSDAEEEDIEDDTETTDAAMSEEEQSEVDEEEEDEEKEQESQNLSGTQSPEIGMEFLINLEAQAGDNALPEKKPGIEITDIAAGAESIQPKGNTLSTAQVVTKVPILLKGTLREYQHIGLDWLVAMYEKKLNGILADEMGLGKTIQTISLLAHLACEKSIWGPHLIVVPTSVMLNWEMEFKKWCPGFKIITYYGNPKERKLKRQGWTKPNTFHVCITSYKLVIQDHASFRRKRWQYLILDEAQHIKNFKSQRWQMLLNFNTSRRLLLTGTPLQNNLMELWSLMHFLMPNVFSSHRDFKDWFVNPVTGMIEGNNEFNEALIRRLHKVLRPFLLRRVKMDVEQQMPKKYEHIVPCRLSKRQRFLYEEFMSLTKTKETLASGNFLSVINVLMQLRKVCNHPNLFEARPVTSPLTLPPLVYHTASLATRPFERHPLDELNLGAFNLRLIDYSFKLSAFASHRIKRFQTPARLIEEIDGIEQDLPPFIPKGKLHLKVTTTQRTNTAPIHISPPVSAPVIRAVSTRSTISSSSSNLPLSRPCNRGILMHGADASNVFKALNNSNSSNVRSSNGSLWQGQSPMTEVNSKQDENLFVFKRFVTGQIKVSQPSNCKINGCINIGDTSVARKREEEHKERLRIIAKINSIRCSCCALYGSDLIDVTNLQTNPSRLSSCSSFNQGRGHFECLFHLNEQLREQQPLEPAFNLNLANLLKSSSQRSSEMNTLLDKFVFLTPPAATSRIQLHVSHPCSSKAESERQFEKRLEKELVPRTHLLHRVRSNMSTQFPELRLIQYDCGKLQRLDKLLWDLKANQHRVLIFTQMSRMLDIFEQFLNHHGHTYLRLDGTTRIEQRQALMERFNADKRIFCFILSTRSGGVGVNLTGADTVIFYDSDWNPTMDAQAQDRCHRIGQTRDVHIYRLISEMTIEENILKKARQKKFLGDVAIEGGNFTTAFFKNDSIRELFNVAESKSITEEVRAIASESSETKDTEERTNKMDVQLSQALETAEEETDVAAAKVATEEAQAELAEFDENIPIDGGGEKTDEKSPEEEELEKLVHQLTPIEKYAMSFLETIQEPIQAEQLKQAEEEIEAQKREWELEHLKSLKEEEERVANHCEADDLLTLSNEEASQVKNRSNKTNNRQKASNSRSKSFATSNVPSRDSGKSPGRSARSFTGKVNERVKVRSPSSVSPVTQVIPTKRSNRVRPSVNYARINEGVEDIEELTPVRRSARSPLKPSPVKGQTSRTRRPGRRKSVDH